MVKAKAENMDTVSRMPGSWLNPLPVLYVLCVSVYIAFNWALNCICPHGAVLMQKLIELVCKFKILPGT